MFSREPIDAWRLSRLAIHDTALLHGFAPSVWYDSRPAGLSSSLRPLTSSQRRHRRQIADSVVEPEEEARVESTLAESKIDLPCPHSMLLTLLSAILREAESAEEEEEESEDLMMDQLE